MTVSTAIRDFVGSLLRSGPKPQIKQWSKSDHAKLYRYPRDITGELRWVAYDPDHQLIRMHEKNQCGAWLELIPAATEGRPDAYVDELGTKLREVINGALPEEDDPWIVQIITFHEPSLLELFQQFAAQTPEELRESAFNQHWMAEMDAHFKQVVQPKGIFDEAATRAPWRGRRLRTFCTLYRRHHYPSYAKSAADCVEARDRLISALQAAGIQAEVRDDHSLYYTLFPWLTPHCDFTGGDPYAAIQMTPWADPDERPLSWDFADMVVSDHPESHGDGTWSWSGVPCAAQSLQNLTVAPKPGHLTAERRFGAHTASLMDQLPEGTRIVMTVVIQPQYQVDRQLSVLKGKSNGRSEDAVATRREIKRAEELRAEDEHIYPMSLTVYSRADAPDDHKGLRKKMQQVQSVLQAEGVKLIDWRHELFGIHAYLQSLPFCYDQALDRKTVKRTQLHHSHTIAHLLPVFGRSIGTDNAALPFFNRGGDRFTFDPIRDRIRNAHMKILGPPGSGKSALLVYMLLQMMAVHRPRLYILDLKWPAPSFTLLANEFEAHGLSVNHLRFSPDTATRTNPFAQASHIVDDAGQYQPPSFTGEGDENRDPLGEMLLLGKTLITGGEKSESDHFRRADRTILQEAILKAGMQTRLGHTRANQTLIEDVVQALKDIAVEHANAPRIQEMAEAMAYFCEGENGRIFNEPAEPFPDSDVTLIEMASLTLDGKESEVTAAFMSLMLNIQAQVFANQDDGRHNIVVADEFHIVATNPFLGPFMTKLVKVWRAVGTWFWPASQNLDDYPDGTRKMLNNLDWWITLSLPKDEITKLRALKGLTDEQAALVAATRKEPGHFTEGVVLHENLNALFRIVMPPRALANAQTEKDERTARKTLQEQLGISEQEAITHVAQQIYEKRNRS